MKLLGAFEQRRSQPSSPSSLSSPTSPTSSSSTRKKDKSTSRSGTSLTIATSETSSLSVFALTLKPSRNEQDDFVLESRERASTIVKTTQKTLRGLPENEHGNENERNHRNRSKDIQYLDRDELTVGATIAMGGFGLITQVHAPILSPSRKYVMKTLVPLSHAASDAKLISAAHQLAKERYFLSQLSHPNIVFLHAMSRGGLAVIRQTQRLDSYFIIEEYLPVQLNERMKDWRIQQEKQRQPRWTSSKKRKMHPQVFLEQVTCAVQIASALQYLHQQRVIFRDIKPANIGLTQEGRNIKVFDFGLAVQLPKGADLDALQPSLQGSHSDTWPRKYCENNPIMSRRMSFPLLSCCGK